MAGHLPLDNRKTGTPLLCSAPWWIRFILLLALTAPATMTGAAATGGNSPLFFMAHRSEAAGAAMRGTTAFGGDFALLGGIHGRESPGGVVRCAPAFCRNPALCSRIHGRKPSQPAVRSAAPLGRDFPLPLRIHGRKSAAARSVAGLVSGVPVAVTTATTGLLMRLRLVEIVSTVSVTNPPATGDNLPLFSPIQSG